MLSVVLYGRNDSHGYNLHKRAAISLNAIAELLDDPDDEILFVDYNTPDDLPTFPEAIADTLTEKAAKLLRILRVRPEVHRRRFAARTHLQALEPIARNVAIRRSNPNNRWVLSTNTDMIFCPRAAGDSLGAVVGRLADGFYHLPRFELPEGLWETLDRKDAPALIEAARTWGQRYHLNEITFADRSNVYDAPGDFQLFLREDLFKIGGFHEEMILGWHLDANVAKRMRLLRGQVSSALDHLIGYHCDHTRQASPYHKVDRTENDQVRFDDEVTAAPVAEQMQTWGLPDVDVEEMHLGHASHARYLAALEASVPGSLTGFLETQYVREDFGRLAYPVDHVLPYLLDLVSCLPSATRIAYVGARIDTFDKFLRGWTAMGGAKVLVPQSASWLGAASSEVDRVDLQGWLDRADMFVFEVGADQAARQGDLTDEETARLWVVDDAFKHAVAADLARQAGGAHPRRAVVVNGVHNFFEPQVEVEVAITLTPYSSRVRQGYITDRAAARIAAADPARRTAMRALNALEPFAKSEVVRLKSLLDRLREAAPDDPIWRDGGRAGAELEALVSSGVLDAGLHPTTLISALRNARPSGQVRSTTLDPAAGDGARNRLIRVEDWDDPAWALIARRLFDNRDHALLYGRDVWFWERVSLAQNLMATVAPGARVLVAGAAAEPLAFALARLGYTVDIADPVALAAGSLKSVDWRPDFKRDAWVSREPVGLVEDRQGAIDDGLRYDAALIVQNGLFIAGRVAAGDVLHTAVDVLKPGAHLGFSALSQPMSEDERLQEHALPFALLGDGGLAAALEALAGLKASGGVDQRLTPRTFDRAAEDMDAPSLGPPALIEGVPPSLEAPSVWSFETTEEAADWTSLKAALEAGTFASAHTAQAPATGVSAPSMFTSQDLAHAPRGVGAGRLGSYFDDLQPQGALVRTPTMLRIPAEFGERVAAVCALGRMAAGSYEIDIDVGVNSVARPGPVLAVAAVTQGRVVAELVLEADRPGANRILATLEIGDDGWQGVDLLFKSLSGAASDIQNLALR